MYKTTIMYKIKGGLVDVSPMSSSLTSTQRSTQGLPMKLLVPHPRTEAYKRSFPSAIILWNTFPSHSLSKTIIEGWARPAPSPERVLTLFFSPPLTMSIVDTFSPHSNQIAPS